MKIREIIAESTEQKKVKEVDLLKDISSAIETAYTVLKKDPEILDKANDEQEIDESVRGTIGKLALSAIVGLSGLNAQANESLGQSLATCGGVMMGLGKAMMKTGDPSGQGQRLWSIGQTAYELSGNHGMFNREFKDAMNSMEYGSANAIRQGQSILAQCHQLIDRAVKIEEKRESERRAYLASPAGQAEMERMRQARAQRAEQDRLENERRARAERESVLQQKEERKRELTRNYNQWLDNTNDRIIVEIGKMFAYKEFTADAKPILGKKDWQALSSYASQVIQKMAADIDSRPGSLTAETFNQKMMASAKETYQRLKSSSQSVQNLQDEIIKAESMFDSLASGKPHAESEYKRSLDRL